MQRLSGIDTAFLYLETPTTHMQVQAVMVLDPSTVPGGYSFEKIKAHLAAAPPAAAGVPPPARVRSLQPAPTGVVRRSRLRLRLPRSPTSRCRRPGRSVQVADIVGDIAGRPLDRSRPLWEFWVIEGVEHGAVASSPACTTRPSTACRARACSRRILDLEPKPADVPPADRAIGSPSTNRRTCELVRHAIISRLRRPLPLGARDGDAEPAARRDRDRACAPRTRARRRAARRSTRPARRGTRR